MSPLLYFAKDTQKRRRATRKTDRELDLCAHSKNQCFGGRISALVDIVLKPLVKSLPSNIKDTKDFLAKLKSLPGPLPPNSLLFTMDVVGLYNNIPHRDGLKACQVALDRRDSCDQPTTSIVNLDNLVLELNAFHSEANFFLQVHGTAVGTHMAPSYANVFMGILEE